ncbi:MAG: metallophosphoesterase, partial [Spirochaetia bacterium]|nr:metallophosphoesterase [Spirochaetia bacterium]
MKKFIIPLLASAIMLASCTKDKNDIVVFFTNDVHCGIENNICYAGVVEYRNEALKQTPYVTLVDAGDAVQGDLAGAVSKGEDIIEILNYMNYDVAIPGNHEFDYGMEQFKKLAGMIKCG